VAWDIGARGEGLVGRVSPPDSRHAPPVPSSEMGASEAVMEIPLERVAGDNQSPAG
jgi:hypothetical protein